MPREMVGRHYHYFLVPVALELAIVLVFGKTPLGWPVFQANLALVNVAAVAAVMMV